MKEITRQILEAVAYLHSEGICHRDIKPDNLVVDLDTNKVKLIDFNTATKITVGSYLNEIQGGTGLRMWSAPETRRELFYSAKCDLWSVGCILYYLLSGGHTMDIEKTWPQNLEEVFSFAKLVPEAKLLLEGLLDIEPSHRLSPQDALEFNWFRAIDIL